MPDARCTAPASCHGLFRIAGMLTLTLMVGACGYKGPLYMPPPPPAPDTSLTTPPSGPGNTSLTAPDDGQPAAEAALPAPVTITNP